MATGLLLAFMTGTATRLAQFFGEDEKTYLAEITLGQVSDTYDAEGRCGTPAPRCLPRMTSNVRWSSFRGLQMQTPPPVSAKKINGVRPTSWPTGNVAVELKPAK